MADLLSRAIPAELRFSAAMHVEKNGLETEDNRRMLNDALPAERNLILLEIRSTVAENVMYAHSMSKIMNKVSYTS